MKTEKERLIIEHSTLFVFDMICVVLSYCAAILTRNIVKDVLRNPKYYAMILIFALVLCILSHIFLNLNERFSARSLMAEFFYVTKYDLFMGAALGMVLFLSQNAQDFSRLAFVYFMIYQFVFVMIFHSILKKLLTKTYMRSKGSGKMVVFAPKEEIERVSDSLKTTGAWPHEIVGGVSSRDELFDYIGKNIVDEVFISDSTLKHTELTYITEHLQMSGIAAHVAVDNVGRMSTKGIPEELSGIPVLTYRPAGEDLHRVMVKRITDLIGSIFGMAITIILFPFIAIAIKIDSRGPVFYKQLRVGKNGRTFYLWKFRSMEADAEEKLDELSDENEMSGPMFKMENDPRVTRVGRFLRKTSLDELPQFFQVFAGTMSLIGTRPPTPEEYSEYHLKDRRRISIKPGITGLWQVSGRNEIKDFEEVLRLDLKYIDNWSFGMDVKILFETVCVVFTRKGAM